MNKSIKISKINCFPDKNSILTKFYTFWGCKRQCNKHKNKIWKIFMQCSHSGKF